VCYYASEHGQLIVAHRASLRDSSGGLLIVAHGKLSEGLRYFHGFVFSTNNTNLYFWVYKNTNLYFLIFVFLSNNTKLYFQFLKSTKLYFRFSKNTKLYFRSCKNTKLYFRVCKNTNFLYF
jgi:hypothetical protein